mmetsp:Transcript_29880/g.91706  ORF Transcript_29880/g.91706 Transcript_29880/m.91706 type:complete len:109 (+) Transcript_29880:2973-3299(+)|eukprot:scaffold83310_cov25-Tisochrysis_lutea.AAC.4
MTLLKHRHPHRGGMPRTCDYVLHQLRARWRSVTPWTARAVALWFRIKDAGPIRAEPSSSTFASDKKACMLRGSHQPFNYPHQPPLSCGAPEILCLLQKTSGACCRQDL